PRRSAGGSLGMRRGSSRTLPVGTTYGSAHQQPVMCGPRDYSPLGGGGSPCTSSRGVRSAAACLRASFLASLSLRRSRSLCSRLSLAIVVRFLPLEPILSFRRVVGDASKDRTAALVPGTAQAATALGRPLAAGPTNRSEE